MHVIVLCADDDSSIILEGVLLAVAEELLQDLPDHIGDTKEPGERVRVVLAVHSRIGQCVLCMDIDGMYVSPFFMYFERGWGVECWRGYLSLIF